MWTAVALSVFAELFEIMWQKSDTLRGILKRADKYFSRSIFVFLAMHTGYVATLFISLAYNLVNWPIIGILAFKTMDIFFKLDLLSRLHGDKEMPLQMVPMLDAPIPGWYFLSSILVYPYFIYMAFKVG